MLADLHRLANRSQLYDVRWTGNFRQLEYVKVQYPGDLRYHTVLRMVYFDRIVGLRDRVPM